MEPAKRLHSTACATLFFDMRSYKIESYVPEQNFYQGKDARFWSAAFEDCFVMDLHYGPNIIASCRGTDAIELSLSSTANLLTLFAVNEPFVLPCKKGTLLIYPAWRHLEFALAFLFKESPQTVEKAYQTAQRYAFSTIFDADNKKDNSPQTELEAKLCMLHFYMSRLFGDKRETNAAAHILMIANLIGCRLHEMSVSRIDATLDEREMERLDAYLFCTFMTMRRYNGKVSALPDGDSDKTDGNLQHVLQEYGLRIQQSVREKITKPTVFDLPSQTDIESFAKHPAFASYQITEEDGTVCLHIPLKQKAVLSSISSRGAQRKMTVVLFPILSLAGIGVPEKTR